MEQSALMSLDCLIELVNDRLIPKLGLLKLISVDFTLLVYLFLKRFNLCLQLLDLILVSLVSQGCDIDLSQLI